MLTPLNKVQRWRNWEPRSWTGTPSQWTMFRCYICRALHNAPSTLIQYFKFFMAFIRKMYIMFQLLHLVTWGILSPSIFKCLMVQTRHFILCQTAASYRLQAAGMRFVLCCTWNFEFPVPCQMLYEAMKNVIHEALCCSYVLCLLFYIVPDNCII